MVRKQRELQHRNSIKFSLDDVEGVGRIFELEAQEEEFRRHLIPHLGPYIASSCSSS